MAYLGRNSHATRLARMRTDANGYALVATLGPAVQIGFRHNHSLTRIFRNQGSLENIIRRLIDKDGSITVIKFMELVLYNPGLGYYRKDDIR